MKIVAVRIGDKYGPEYEEYLESKLPEYEFIWVREPIREDVILQWNKMYGMSLDIDEPICVMDIDIILTNDYKEVFEFPIKRGEFACMPGWWREDAKDEVPYPMNGGFFKYYPKDCRYIYDEFMSNTDHWQQYYIKNGVTKGPVNGEQYFVWDQAKKQLDMKLLPSSWFTRWKTTFEDSDNQYEKWQWNMTQKYKEETGNDYIWMGGFHEDIKFVHFTHAQNKPRDWKYFDIS